MNVTIVGGYDFDLNKPNPEKIDKETIVEQSGYEPADRKIMNMIFAGQRLKESRREMYDFDGENDDYDTPIDPTRKPGLDLAEASSILMETQARINAANMAATVANTEVTVVPESVPTEPKTE